MKGVSFIIFHFLQLQRLHSLSPRGMLSYLSFSILSLLLLILCFTNALLEGLSLLDLSKQGGYNSFVTVEEFGSIDKRYTFFMKL